MLGIGIFCVGFSIFRLIALLQSTVFGLKSELEFGTLIESQQCMQTVGSHHEWQIPIKPSVSAVNIY